MFRKTLVKWGGTASLDKKSVVCNCENRQSIGRKIMDLEMVREMKLRVVDKGTVKGKFEVFFGVELPPEVEITWKTCEIWDNLVSRLVVRKGLCADQVSPDLDKLFERFFNVKLPPGNHVTLNMCELWHKKHYQFLIEILQARSVPRSPPDNDSS